MIDRRLLDDINYSVNCMIHYVPDIDVHKTNDKWQMPAETLRRKTGDCEDYAILKASMLVKQGVNKDLLRIAVVKESDGLPIHAVLLAPSTYTTGLWRWKKTRACTYVLDNKRDDLLRWECTPYTIIRLVKVDAYVA